MKKGFRVLTLILAVLLIALPLSLQAAAQNSTADNSISVDMKIGFDKFYKLGYSTPLYFEIENKHGDINGELQVEMPNESDTITLYALNVSLPNNSTKKFVMNVPMSRFTTKLKVNVTDGKNEVFTRTFRIDPGSNSETYAIGILSDDFDSVKYINKISVKNYGNFSTKTVKLDQDSFPVNSDVLKAFNVIVVNNFDTSKLRSEQYDSLKSWVFSGGTLLLGTGPSYNKVLAIFKDEFLTGQIGNVHAMQTLSLYNTTGGTNSAPGEAMNINALDISIKDGTPVINDGNTVLLQKVEKGKGTIGVAAFDFGLEPLSTWVGNSAFAENLIGSILPAYYSSSMIQKGMIVQDNIYAIDNALRNIPELPLPKTKYLVFVYLAYILITAPISYFVLKRMDKRELMWFTVPVLSIIFSIVIYVSGFGTRLTEPITNVISLLDIDNSGTITPKVYAGVFSPNKSNIRIEAGDGIEMRPIVLNQGYYGPGPMPREDSPKRIDSKVIMSPKTILEFYKTGIWSMKTIAINSKNVLTGKIESKLNYAKGEFVGTVKNTSGFDLDECYIITSNQYANIGPVKNGETKQIKVKPSSYFGNRYDLMNAIYKDPYSGPQPVNQRKLSAEEIAKYRQNMQKRQILEYGFMNDSSQGFEARLIGWSSTSFSKDLLVNGKTTKKYEKSFITARVDLSFKDGKTVEYPFGYIKPTIINNLNQGNYDDFGKMFFGRGSFEVHYQIDNSIQIENITTKYNINGAQPPRVRQYIWDLEKGDWVEGDYKSFFISGDLLKKYVDKDNKLKLRFEMDDDSVQLPQISVKGSVQ
ncbi:MAG: hypothetical protein ACM3TR_00265 [Caulobacteraceae bacterium]